MQDATIRIHLEEEETSEGTVYKLYAITADGTVIYDEENSITFSEPEVDVSLIIET